MSFSVGQFVYQIYHRPLTWWRDNRDLRDGRRGEIAMQIAATHLPRANFDTWGLAAPPVRMLTGARFIHQTLFCARSFEWACGSHFNFEIYGDGTLSDQAAAQIRQVLPGATIPSQKEITERLDRALPISQFPLLRSMRDSHPLMRKLLDLHAGLQGPALYLDSDMLFFAPPNLLLNWLRQPTDEYYMHQIGDALVNERDGLSQRIGIPLHAGVNSGILALHDEGFDWPLLERAAAVMTAEERNHKWAEQTLFAVHVSHRQAASLSRDEYFLCHGRESFAGPIPPLRHYIHKSKSIYTGSEWRRWLDLSAASPNGATQTS